MNSRERILTALDHREPDRVPFDLGGMNETQIHRTAYANLRKRLGLPDCEVRVRNFITQMARMDDDILDLLGADAYMVYGRWASPSEAAVREEDGKLAYTDEWGVGRSMTKQSGHYFDVCRHPFDVDDIERRWSQYRWPDPLDAFRFEGLQEEAKRARESGRFVTLMGMFPGILVMYNWLRGYERFYTDLGAEPETVAKFLSKLAELKIAYWERALAEVGEYVDAVNEADDVAGQTCMLMSPNTYRLEIKPFHQEIVSAIKRAAPHVKVLFHSCGAVRPVVHDFIEIGVDILNPMQVSADDMDPLELKRDFGGDICFWGGGVDTQHVLEPGPPEQIREDVRRNLNAFAPCGGFIFSTIHNVQPNIPPEHYIVMWEAFQEHCNYR